MDISGLWDNLRSKCRRYKRPACAGATEEERADATNEDGATWQLFKRRTSPFVAGVLCHSRSGLDEELGYSLAVCRKVFFFPRHLSLPSSGFLHSCASTCSVHSLFVFAGVAQVALRSEQRPPQWGAGPGLRPTRQQGGQGFVHSVFAGQRMLSETSLDTAQEVERVQQVGKVPAAQGSPAPEAKMRRRPPARKTQQAASTMLVTPRSTTRSPPSGPLRRGENAGPSSSVRNLRKGALWPSRSSGRLPR